MRSPKRQAIIPGQSPDHSCSFSNWSSPRSPAVRVNPAKATHGKPAHYIKQGLFLLRAACVWFTPSKCGSKTCSDGQTRLGGDGRAPRFWGFIVCVHARLGVDVLCIWCDTFSCYHPVDRIYYRRCGSRSLVARPFYEKSLFHFFWSHVTPENMTTFGKV